MRVCCLYSGGKDSNFSLFLAHSFGWEMDSLVCVLPQEDSYMFHKINTSFCKYQALALELPFFEVNAENKDELETLKKFLEKKEIDGIVTGAVNSEFQKQRFDVICEELGIKSFGPMWHKNPEKILEEEIESGHEIIITQVSCEGLNMDWLGKKIDLENFEILKKLSKKYGFNIHGEGGEYETFVLDGPLFKKKIKIEDFEILHGALTGMLKIKKVKLVRK